MKNGDLLLSKYNPHHDEKGRFTSEGSATFTSTGNAKAVARMKEKHAEQKAKEKPAERVRHPSVKEGHEELSVHETIVRETDKAVMINNRAYSAALETAAYDIKELSPAQREILHTKQSGTWLPKSQISTHDGKVTGMKRFIAEEKGLHTHEAASRMKASSERREQAFSAAKDKYSSLVSQAKSLGVKGVRTGMRVSSIHEKMRAAGHTPEAWKAEEIADLYKL